MIHASENDCDLCNRIFNIARTTTIMVDMCHMVIIIETTKVIHVILTYSVMRIDD